MDIVNVTAATTHGNADGSWGILKYEGITKMFDLVKKCKQFSLFIVTSYFEFHHTDVTAFPDCAVDGHRPH